MGHRNGIENHTKSLNPCFCVPGSLRKSFIKNCPPPPDLLPLLLLILMIVGRVERFGESGVCVVCVCVCVVGVCGCVEREEESGVWCQVDTKARLLGEPELVLARAEGKKK